MQIPDSDTVLLIQRFGMGSGPADLQQKLITTYFHLMAEGEILPAVICFYTEGVKLTVAGSPVLDSLKLLENRGVRLIMCSTCLEYYQLNAQVQVGIAGSMADILEAQRLASKVITI